MPTRSQNERAVLNCLRKHRRVSIFWITDNQQRASAVQRLQDNGVIVRHRKSKHDAFPWCVFSIAKSASKSGIRR